MIGMDIVVCTIYCTILYAPMRVGINELMELKLCADTYVYNIYTHTPLFADGFLIVIR